MHKQLESGVFVKYGEYSGIPLYSVDKNVWYSTEAKALEVHSKKLELQKLKGDEPCLI